MDSLPFGCPRLIRNCLDKSIKRTDLISILNLEKILEIMPKNMDAIAMLKDLGDLPS